MIACLLRPEGTCHKIITILTLIITVTKNLLRLLR